MKVWSRSLCNIQPPHIESGLAWLGLAWCVETSPSPRDFSRMPEGGTCEVEKGVTNTWNSHLLNFTPRISPLLSPPIIISMFEHYPLEFSRHWSTYKGCISFFQLFHPIVQLAHRKSNLLCRTTGSFDGSLEARWDDEPADRWWPYDCYTFGMDLNEIISISRCSWLLVSRRANETWIHAPRRVSFIHKIFEYL